MRAISCDDEMRERAPFEEFLRAMVAVSSRD